tara:strand:+ start:520 stop:945 length:426 start_codon:yes stop_codon:yes gene_type:complete
MTVSLEKAQALKAAGWPQEDGVLYWYYGKDYTKNNVRRILWNAGGNNFVDHRREKVSCPLPSDFVVAAPTPEEILQKLPKIGAYDIDCYRHTGGWLVAYVDFSDKKVKTMVFKDEGVEFTRETLCDALSDMYIYLSQHNLL